MIQISINTLKRPLWLGIAVTFIVSGIDVSYAQAASTNFAASATSKESVFEEWQEKIEPSIEKGLDYLAKSQNKDGSFPKGFGTSTGIPALAGMAFFPVGTFQPKVAILR